MNLGIEQVVHNSSQRMEDDKEGIMRLLSMYLVISPRSMSLCLRYCERRGQDQKLNKNSSTFSEIHPLLLPDRPENISRASKENMTSFKMNGIKTPAGGAVAPLRCFPSPNTLKRPTISISIEALQFARKGVHRLLAV